MENDIWNRIAVTLERIAIAPALRAVAQRQAIALETRLSAAPELSRDLYDYPQFDWASIGAEVVARDQHGAIDETVYERLITFRETKVAADPLNDKTIALLRRGRA
jgi:hypothetical protein